MRNECLMAIKQTRLLNFTHKKTAMLSGADFRFVLRLRALIESVLIYRKTVN
uniref:Uncharacterized protein n=1 Tax=Phage sp. ct17O1 TaxID=2825789 RepID=A0A8S5PJZ1_9VIRU|nr:MAG TPA: hypothetical protein [Phage sp. ct17O1]DAV02617.1 MAG TPA: hypothetical protein [Bacteriophage sp.]DAX41020.1 MAG TPA: hypothetical protein [Bacteriophage sp.]